ncbi:peptide-methionine (R)-S-oxide reductase [Tenacibaculum sp. Bg11-29]|uniref:peptide-methionine (R)-S-oxide reductase MsrB n=1 Tax=Tenacibaculum sp. Bg11-29 TaxID=2058306 RepID=UPI000C326D2E|nr:peptide-methionine (R)-S-oxide reductase MsrB [Tenacibaculum sp. Bg11-29]PKH51929.1 peptide-methionine (R)-S-oxide reductase [Tenacibaculum sp. Bg11-29]
MKKILFAFVLTILFNYLGNAQDKKEYKVSKTNKEWKTLLTKKQYYVLREAGTERQNSSSLNKNYKKGLYVCAACKTPLYKSENKYDSGSGWPAFDKAIKKNVELDVDYKIGYARTELKCNTCGGHLGHSFDDGPRDTTGKRHCINGAALEFISK